MIRNDVGWIIYDAVERGWNDLSRDEKIHGKEMHYNITGQRTRDLATITTRGKTFWQNEVEGGPGSGRFMQRQIEAEQVMDALKQKSFEDSFWDIGSGWEIVCPASFITDGN